MGVPSMHVISLNTTRLKPYIVSIVNSLLNKKKLSGEHICCSMGTLREFCISKYLLKVVFCQCVPKVYSLIVLFFLVLLSCL